MALFFFAFLSILATTSISSSSSIINYIQGKKCDRCEMSIMSPDWTDITSLFTIPSSSFPYSLMQYTEGNLKENIPINLLIFVPGSQGSYGQGRSLWTTMAPQEDSLMISLDFKGEISAFNTEIISRQTLFLLLTLKEIISFIEREGDIASITLIGHSFGGIVIRLLSIIWPDYYSFITKTVLIASPLESAPITLHPAMINLFKKINEAIEFNKKSDLLLSISSHHSDILVPSIPSFNHFITLKSTSLPHVWSDPNHEAMIWERGIIGYISDWITKEEIKEDLLMELKSFAYNENEVSFDELRDIAIARNITKSSIKCSSLPTTFITSLPPCIFRINNQLVKPVPSMTLNLQTLIGNSKTDITKTLWRWSVRDNENICFLDIGKDEKKEKEEFWSEYLDEKEENRLSNHHSNTIFGLLRRKSILFSLAASSIFPRIFTIPRDDLIYLRFYSSIDESIEIFPTLKDNSLDIIIWIDDCRINEFEYLCSSGEEHSFKFKELFLFEYVVSIIKNPEIFIIRPIYVNFLLHYLFRDALPFPLFLLHILVQELLFLRDGSISDYGKYFIHLIMVFCLCLLCPKGYRNVPFIMIPLIIPLIYLFIWIRNCRTVGFGMMYRFQDLIGNTFVEGGSDINYGLLYIGVYLSKYYSYKNKVHPLRILSFIIISMNSEPHRWMEVLAALVL